jgi:hypothetical protein
MNGKKYPREFERVTKDGSVQRLRLPGGWIVIRSEKHLMMDKAVACSGAMEYVPDRTGDPYWQLEGE